MLRLSRLEKAKALATRALRGLAGFAKALKFKYEDIEVGFDFDPEPGLADNGDLEHDLQSLLDAAGAAAQQADTALAPFIDELQYVPEDQLAALITALHRCAQRQLPVMLVGAGLPSFAAAWGGLSHTPKGCSTFRRSGLCHHRPPKMPSPNRRRPKASKSPSRPSGASWKRRMVTHTSFRNGASTPGMWPPPHPSAPITSR